VHRVRSLPRSPSGGRPAFHVNHLIGFPQGTAAVDFQQKPIDLTLQHLVLVENGHEYAKQPSWLAVALELGSLEITAANTRLLAAAAMLSR
jgi:hypothetical protein